MKKITVCSVEDPLESSEKGCRGASVWGLWQKSGESWCSGPEEVGVGMERGGPILEMPKKIGLHQTPFH